MKLIRNNVCYVGAKDLVREPLPKFKDPLPDCSGDNDYIAFKSEEAINYFKEREDIIDYDSISSLSEEELDNTINEIHKKINEMALRWLSSSQNEREQLYKDKKLTKRQRTLSYAYESLRDYQNNRERIDALLKPSAELNQTDNRKKAHKA